MLRGIFRVAAVLVCTCGFLFAADPVGIWLDVPFVKQEKNGCGAASIAMVMQFWQHQQGQTTGNADAGQIQHTLYSSSAHGIYASDLEHYLGRNGYRTFAFAGTREDLRQHLEKGRPLIVALKPGSRTPLHYVVVAGIDVEQGTVLLNDPAERKLLKQDAARFEKERKNAGNWTLLAVPQSKGTSSAH
jgi:ABC-type bacteriocin/lantibiotic exporter with double-glycine peptidase domain